MDTTRIESALRKKIRPAPSRFWNDPDPSSSIVNASAVFLKDSNMGAARPDEPVGSQVRIEKDDPQESSHLHASEKI